jgi:hypothetical protein
MSRRIVDPFKEKIIEAEKARAEEASKKASSSPPSSGVDLKDLLGKTRTILYREIQNLMEESTGALLSKDSSQALVNYIKLLKDLVKEEDAIFDDMTDEQLEALLKKKEK